jgi:hypothetical protein
MPRLLLFCVCGFLSTSDVLLGAAEMCPPRLPCKACIESEDFGYYVGDCRTCATHFSVKEDQQTLSCKVKTSRLDFKSDTQTTCQSVKTRICEPTTVTRSFAFPSCKLEPRAVKVEVAFAERKCCIDACGHCYVCISSGPHQDFVERDYHARPVTRTVCQSAETIACRDVNREHNFDCKTIRCNISHSECDVSTTGRKLSFTGHECCVSTGCVTLNKKPAVHTVPVCCPPPRCPLVCVSCCYTPRCAASACETNCCRQHPAVVPPPVVKPEPVPALPPPAAATDPGPAVPPPPASAVPTADSPADASSATQNAKADQPSASVPASP